MSLKYEPAAQGSRMIEVDMGTREDKALFQGAQKLLGILITIIESVAYVRTPPTSLVMSEVDQ